MPDLIPVQPVRQGRWIELIEKWGRGKAGPRYMYHVECTQAKFPNHLVLRGPGQSGVGFTDSGFLVDRFGSVIGGVDAINRKF